MTKIKIISNPYQKETVFQSWDDVACEWKTIDPENNANSKLLRDELRIGFFPFKVKQIVDIIIEEYCVGTEPVEIVFEGTEDEYDELKSICDENSYLNLVSVSRSSIGLENARDILQDIIAIFKELSSLISESVSDKEKVRQDLEKFSDASNSIIPICVIGNYSSGKSTFINALVGYELLPSSDEPTTAKIYKISQSDYMDRALIKFEYAGRSVRLRFSADSYKFLTDPQDNPLTEKLKVVLDEIAGDTIPIKLSKVLEVINTYANGANVETISDLIEIEAPFDEDGLWGKIWNNFVIFDTPGSNSASNVKHYEVLKRAMEGLTNGLPVFVSEYDSLDSTDNDKLYQDINNMEELDNRFTMIIVNKADAASLKKTGYTDEDRDRILSLAIPKKLYSGGIYFVSSIMGLGSKNDEIFIDDHNAEVFEDQKNKYVDPDSRFYKRLYQYNIMPEQIKRKYDALSEEHKNLIYANSGLYSIEQAIETFAGVYSHYNKCQQSQLFLGKVIQITFDEIAAAKQEKEEYKDRIHKNLEKEKRELLDRLEQCSVELHEQFIQDYPAYMEEYIDQANSIFSPEQLSEQEALFLQTKESEKDVEGRKSDFEESTKSLLDSLVDNLANAVREKKLSSIRKIGSDFSEGVKEIKENQDKLHKTKEEVKREASDELISFVRNTFTNHMNEAQSLLDSQSRSYWASMTERFKQELSQIVTNSTALTDEKRNELAGIIIEYQELAFKNEVEKIFDKTAFRRIFGDTNRLNITRLARRYNKEMADRIEKIYLSFQASHAGSFDSWKDSLMDTVRENIVEFSPELHNQFEIIRKETEKIAELEYRRQKLSEYTAQIEQMMDWKEI